MKQQSQKLRNANLTYSEVVKSLLQLINPQKSDPPKRNFSRIQYMRELLATLEITYGGNFIHIAGTKGKSSIATMLAHILTANGTQNLLFTSPSMHKIVERFQINCQPIEPDLFAKLAQGILQKYQSASPKSPLKRLTLFECLTALMLHIHTKPDMRISVVETGIGGRLDATNVISPLISVISTIELDHCNVLGDNIPAIALEKAGIIKPRTPVVISKQSDEALSVLRTVARQQFAPIISSEEHTALEHVCHTDKGAEVVVNTQKQRYRFNLNMLGAHQIDNARVAITVAEILAESSLPIKAQAITDGLEQVRLPGRIQVVRNEPYPLIVDGCQTALSAGILTQTVKTAYPKSSDYVVILGCLDGHENMLVIKELMALNPRFIVTQPNHPRALSAETVFNMVKKFGIRSVDLTQSVTEALNILDSRPNPDVCIACGSLATAAAVIQSITATGSDFN